MTHSRLKRVIPVVLLACVSSASAQTVGWSGRVVSATTEEPQVIVGGSGGAPPSWPGRPAGHRWLKVTVQLASPGRDAALPLTEIRLRHGEEQHALTAIGGAVKAKGASILYLPVLSVNPPHPDSGMKKKSDVKLDRRKSGTWGKAHSPDFAVTYDAFFEGSNTDKMHLMVSAFGPKGRALTLPKSTAPAVFLFAVPEQAANLELQLGNAAPIAIPATAGH